MEQKLSKSDQDTYEHVLQQSMTSNLTWRDVWSMFSAMPDTAAVEEIDGSLKVTRNGETLLVHRPKGKNLADAEELLQVRHFLERSETKVPALAVPAPHLLVVVDHGNTRIYAADLLGQVARLGPESEHAV